MDDNECRQKQPLRNIARLLLTGLLFAVSLVTFAACAPASQPNSSPGSATETEDAVTASQTSTHTGSGDNSQRAAVFEGDTTTLRLPQRYREWVFVGSSLGLQYNGSPGNTFNHVYIDPVAYREYAKTGTFPEGTVLILELLTPETKQEQELQGTIEVGFESLEASVKDSVKFPGKGWGYYIFGDPAKPNSTATPASSACWECHHKMAETDHVFTQFYPILHAARSR